MNNDHGILTFSSSANHRGYSFRLSYHGSTPAGTLDEGNPLANGKRGDHPVNDICDHGLLVFSPTADQLIRGIHEYLPRYRMWDLLDWYHLPPIHELEELLARKLAELQADAKARGWEST